MAGSRADLFIHNGTIYTMDRAHRIVSAIAVEAGRIVALGDDRETGRRKPRGCEVLDMRGMAVLPGFIDCHTHFIQMGLDSMGVDLSRTRSLSEALSMIRTAGRSHPEGEWLIAAGWKESGWPENRFITRQDLDSCCSTAPVVAHRICGHLSTVNSKALEILCIDPKTPDVDLEKGLLRESALQLPMKHTEPDDAKKAKALVRATRMAHELGVTSVNDNGLSSDFGIYRQAERRGELGVRVWLNTPSADLGSRVSLGISSGFGTDWLKLGGLKVFCDGALGARTAALSSPYSDDPRNKGKLVIERAELEGLISTANEAGIQVAVHAIGDVGIGEVISAYSKAMGHPSSEDPRNRIEHLELPSPAQLLEMRRMGLLASMQPNFVGEWGGTEGMYLSRLGPTRTKTNNPFRDVLRSKVRLVFGSDCMPMSPMYGIQSAVDAPYPSQRISTAQAVAAYTRDAALASFEETSKGVLKEGMLADMVVLSEDPFKTPNKLGSISVLRTIVGGVVRYERRGAGK